MMESYGLNLTSGAIWTVAVIVVIYFVAIAFFGGYFARFSRDINDFFFSGQRFAWWLGAGSMIATGIGSYSYLKYSQQGYETGMSSAITYTNDWFIMPFFIFGWLPIIYFSRVKSIPEYFERRFNRLARYISLVIIMAYMFFYIGYNLFTIGVAIEGFLGIPMLYSVPLVTLVLGAYVTMGGQTAVIFTDLVQGFMLYLAGLIAIGAGVIALGGLGEFWSWLPITHRLPFVDLVNDPNFNTSGLFWGEAMVGSIAFAFMNQGFIMRYLAMKSVDEGRKATFFNVLLTLPTAAIIVGAVGWLAKALVVKQAAMGGALEGLAPIFITNHFHTFIVVTWETLKHNALLFGFVIAALTAALMSTVDTLINACAAIGINDLYRPLIKPHASERHYLIAARFASGLTAFIGLLLVIWFSRQRGTLMSIHYKGIMIIIPAVVTTIFLGVFWKRFNAWGACVSMVVGSIITVITVISPEMIRPISWFVSGPLNGEYLYMRALFGALVTAIVGIIVTLLTRPQSSEQLAGLTIDTIDEAMEKYKGGKPNHLVGEKVKYLPVRLDSEMALNVIGISCALMEKLKAEDGDLIYMEDARWYLGGLRSKQVRAKRLLNLKDDHVVMSKQTHDEAMLQEGRAVTLEKIF